MREGGTVEEIDYRDAKRALGALKHRDQKEASFWSIGLVHENAPKSFEFFRGKVVLFRAAVSGQCCCVVSVPKTQQELIAAGFEVELVVYKDRCDAFPALYLRKVLI